MSKMPKRGDEGSSSKRKLDCDAPENCSICLQPLNTDEPRGMARLQCSHEFHLDCIGSEFNIKGNMVCPNCRDVEIGQWMFAAASGERMYCAAEHHPFFVVPAGFSFSGTHGIMDENGDHVGGYIIYVNRDFFTQLPLSSPTQRPNTTSNVGPNAQSNGTQMGGTSTMPWNLNNAENPMPWNFHTSTLFFGHTASSSQRRISCFPLVANQDPSTNIFANGGAGLPQNQHNNPYPASNFVMRELSPHGRSWPLPCTTCLRRQSNPSSRQLPSSGVIYTEINLTNLPRDTRGFNPYDPPLPLPAEDFAPRVYNIFGPPEPFLPDNLVTRERNAQNNPSSPIPPNDTLGTEFNPYDLTSSPTPPPADNIERHSYDLNRSPDHGSTSYNPHRCGNGCSK